MSTLASKTQYWLKRLRKDCTEKLQREKCITSEQELVLWLFRFDENANALVHWDLLPEPAPDISSLLQTIVIPSETGTIGYVVQTQQPQCVENTFDDPRGIVATMDSVLGNYAWCGIPVLEELPDRSKKVIAVVSFFPRGGDHKWQGSPVDTDTICKHLNGVIEKEYTGVLELLTYAELQRATAQHALDQITYHGDETLRDTLAEDLDELLDQIRYVAYRTYAFKNILFIQQSDDGSYQLRDSTYLKHDYNRTQVRGLDDLQWASVQAFGKPREVERQLFGEHVATFEPGDGPMLFKGYVRGNEAIVNQLLEEYFGHFEPLFRCLRALDVENNLSQRKKSLDIKVQLFEFLAKLLCRACHVVSATGLLTEPLRTRLRELIDLIHKQRDEFICRDGSEALSLLTNADGLASHLQRIRSLALTAGSDLIALGFWIRLPQWQVTSASGLAGGVDALKAPSTWKVLLRAIAPGNEHVLTQYPPLLPIKNCVITETDEGQRTLAGQVDAKPFNVTFVRKNALFPLALHLQWRGYERLLFERHGQWLGFPTEQVDGQDVKTVQLKYQDESLLPDVEVDLNRTGLRGHYAVLAKNHTSLIVAGPTTAVTGAVPRTPPPELTEFCQKSLRVILLAESRRQFRRVSLRSGIARIMARNMSHNIGSHALWHRGEFLRSLIRQLEDNSRALPQKEEYVRHLEQGEQFIRYLQKRMDFIAQVSTASPSWCQAMRWSELINGLTGQACLLDNIVLSYDITGSENLEITPIPDLSKAEGANKSTDNHLDVAHGGIGAHAFYSIVENILRNCAKYGNWDQLKGIKDAKGQTEPKLKLILSIRLADSWPDATGRADGWSRDFYRVTIQDNLVTTHDELQGLENGISDPIIDPEKETLGPRNWGLKEIKICAAYLRLLRLEQLDEKYAEYNRLDSAAPPLVTVSLQDSDGRPVDHVGFLTYTFYILRPKKALAVGKAFEQLKSETFRQVGIDYLDNFEKLKREIAAKQFPRHSFLVLDNNDIDYSWLADHANCLPNRIVTVGGAVSESDAPLLPDRYLRIGSLPDQAPDTLLAALWKTWVGRHYDWSRLCCRWQFKDDLLHKPNLPLLLLNEGESSELQGLLVYDHADAGQYIGGSVDRTESEGHALYHHAAFHECLDLEHPARNLFFELKTYTDQQPNPSMVADYAWLQEASAVSVAVIDERIFPHRDDRNVQGIGTKRYSKDLTLGEALAKRRVHLLDPYAFEGNLEAFADNAIMPLQSPQSPIEASRCFDFLVIHQGVVDHMKKIYRREFGDKWQSKFSSGWLALKGKARWVVVESGRGKPDLAANEGLRWVEYSSLAQVLMLGTKLDLVVVLFSLRGEHRSQGDV